MQQLDVTIAGRNYTIRSGLAEERIREVSAFVEKQLALTAAAAPSADSYRVAVLTLLNVAGELFAMRSGATDSDVEKESSVALHSLLARVEDALGVDVGGQ